MPAGSTPDDVLLRAEDVRMHFTARRGVAQRVVGQVRAVDGVSLTIHRGETVGLVGESGCGKTTLGRCLLRLVEPTGGRVWLNPDGEPVEVTALPRNRLREIRRHMQMVFQDPQSSLDPRMTVGDIIAEPLVANRLARGRELEARVRDLMRRVGLLPHHARRYPHAFSGGQRQRIGIARALALNPKLIIADEPVSALDVSIRAQVLNLLADLSDELGLSYLLIAHDLTAVAYLSDRVAMMYLGRIAERAATQSLFARPRHPYTEALMSALPVADPRLEAARRRIRPKGEPPDPAHPPEGCHYHPRCAYVVDVCRLTSPGLVEWGAGHWAACHRAGELVLRGVGE